jgi:hypothetical protein
MTRSLWIRVTVGAVLLALGLVPAVADAQSLATVARQEEARRKQTPKAGKVYTNESLTRDHTTPTTPAAPASAGSGAATASAAADHGAATAPATPPAAEAAGAAAPTPARDQAYWRDRVGAARAQLERSKTFADALQSRVSALTTDFVNRDDPAQRAVIDQNRLKAVAELERVQREIAAHTKAISDIEDEARKAGVPAGWLR